MSVNLNMLKATDLERTLRGTIYSRYKSVIDNYILSKLKNEGTNFDVPIVQVVLGESSGLKKALLDLYDKKMSFEDTSGISEEIKLLQASVFDSLVVGVNVEKGGEFAIYTANMNTIFSTDSNSKFAIEKTVELNRQGIINAVRMDIEYTTEEGFTYKPVSLNKNTNLKTFDMDKGEGRFLLVPYIVIQRSMVFFKSMLDDRRILEVKQSLGDVVKTRYITTREDALAHYSDNKEFVKSLSPEYFPLKCFFYAPVLGAPSTTLGKTRIDIINIDEVRSVSKPKVEKAKNGINALVVDSVVQSELEKLRVENTDEYIRVVCSLPRIRDFIPDVDSIEPSVLGVVKYLHSLHEKDYEKAIAVINAHVNISDRSSSLGKVINTFENVDVSSLDNDLLKSMLKDGVYKIIIRKKNCEYSSMVVSNNKDILKMVYGDDYFGKYESLGTRLYKLESMIESSISISDYYDNKGNTAEKEYEMMGDIYEALTYCGFNSDSATVKEVFEIMITDLHDKNHHDRLAELFSEGKSKKPVRKSASSNVILARKLFASATSEGVEDYYRYIDISKIVSMYKLG